MVAVGVEDGAAVGLTTICELLAVTRRISVARVGVLLGVRVGVGVFVLVGVAVKVAVSVGVMVSVLVAIAVGNTAMVASSAIVSRLVTLNVRNVIPTPRQMRARRPRIHFFTQSTPVSALTDLLHRTDTGANFYIKLVGSDLQFSRVGMQF